MSLSYVAAGGSDDESSSESDNHSNIAYYVQCVP